MSKFSLKSPKPSQTTTATERSQDSEVSKENAELDFSMQPEFIYGGPFAKCPKPVLMDIVTPINVQLQGSFKRSFAYYSLKERFPVILTKVIDYLSREGNKVKAANKASDKDVRNLIQYIVQLKNEIATNKRYTLLSVDTPESRQWNDWIRNADSPYYFTNNWVFSECYVYRRLREGCELCDGLVNFDPFEQQKMDSFTGSLEPMCVVAEKVLDMLQDSEKEKRKANFMTLLKVSLWSNKCDLSLSMGEQVTLIDKENLKTSPSQTLIDPIQMVLDFKDKVLVDDSAKISDQVMAKAESLAKTLEAAPPREEVPTHAKEKVPPPAGEEVPAPAGEEVPPPAGEEVPPPAGEGKEEPPPQAPCPTKLTVPTTVMFDIVCDNAGYELFTDLCLADFLISQNIVKKVRFHVKKIPWFVSDVTPKDFNYVISQCAASNFNKVVQPPPQPEGAEGEPPSARTVTATALQALGRRWGAYLDNGTFEVLCEDFWTSPHVYKDMKKYDPQLYRDLQFAVAVLFKGDLNYRKLLGERNCNPIASFESSLQGFKPAPVIALRTVKADLICGLPKGKAQQLSNIDDKWMEKGDYGVIQFCAKSDPRKVSDRPCSQYGDSCRGEGCGGPV